MREITKEQLFQRQTTLAEFGESGQNKLLNAKVLIIGCGGLGNTAAVTLATSGIGHLHLIDFDVVDISNLHRQVFFNTNQIGQPKAECLATYIRNVAPFTRVNYTAEAVSKSNIFKFIHDVDIVLDCTDQLEVKYLINDACVIKDKTLIYGSLYKFDGYVASFNALDPLGNRTANLRDAFPEIPKNSVPNCSEAGTLNTIVGIIAIMQANEVIKIITGIGNPLINQLQIYNSLDSSQYAMKLKNTFDKIQIQSIFEREKYTGFTEETQKRDCLITAADLKKKIAKEDNFQIISVIENTNTLLPFEVNSKIPLSLLNVDSMNFDEKTEYIIVCNKGISSYIATERIKDRYPELRVLSLENGITKY